VRQAVLFYPGVQKILDAGCTLVIEVGPHPALVPAIAAATDPSKVRCVTTLLRDQQDVAHVLEGLAALHVTGTPIAMDRVFWNAAYRRVPLPLYPFRRDRHWIRAELEGYRSPGIQAAAPDTPAALPQIRDNLHPLIGKVSDVSARRVVFETSLAAARPWVDHRVLNSTVFPGTAYLEMAVRGFAAVAGKDWRSVVLRDVAFERPLILGYRKPRKVSLTLDNLAAGGNGEADFVISADGNGTVEKCCRGRIAPASETVEQVALDAELSRRRSETPVGMFYGELRKRGLEYGASFSTVRELWLGDPDSGEAFGRISFSAHAEGADTHPFVSTVLLDGCLHAFGAALETFGDNDRPGAYVPVSIQSITLRREIPVQVWSHVTVRLSSNGRAALAHIRVLTDAGEVVAEFDGLELRQTASLGSARDDAGAGNGKSHAAAIFQSRDQFMGRLRELSKDERVEVVVKWLAAEVKDTLGHAGEDLDIDNLDPSIAFLEIGLDSLLVTELQRRIQEKLNFRFQPMQGLDYQSIESLAAYIANEVLVVERAQTAPHAEPALSQQGV
jgi:acyl transferase domain-containing protein